MRLPEFTAEASLNRASGEYTGFSTGASRPGNSSVVAQYDFSTLGIDYWALVASQRIGCNPPFCSLDSFGRCHCRTAALPVGI
jgi:hypothetical protein